MATSVTARKASRETIQPSLWDRLVDDLPGLLSELHQGRKDLAADIGAEKVEDLLDGGVKAVEADGELTDGQKKVLHKLLRQEKQRAFLEERGIIVSSEVLREAVRRDLEALFNTERFEAGYLLTDEEYNTISNDLLDLRDFPEVRRSVVNFGVPSFAGRSGSSFDKKNLAKEIKEILGVFEPRLKRDSIKVVVSTDPKKGLKIDIDGLLIMTPTPERLRFRTSIDLNNGQAQTAMDDV